MNLIKSWSLLLIAAFLLSEASFAQSNTDFIWEPQLSYSWKSSDRLGFKTKASMFNSIPDFNNNAAIQYAEAAATFAYGLSVQTKIGGGYLYRLSAPLQDGYAYEHRFIQQIGFITYFGDRRIANRFRTEQRIRSGGYINRFRYRLSYDIPLEGDRLDAGERYLILSDEMMAIFNKNTGEGENRAYVGMGWVLDSKQKFELGLQYRTQDIFTDGGVGHLFLIGTSFYLNR